MECLYKFRVIQGRDGILELFSVLILKEYDMVKLFPSVTKGLRVSFVFNRQSSCLEVWEKIAHSRAKVDLGDGRLFLEHLFGVEVRSRLDLSG